MNYLFGQQDTADICPGCKVNPVRPIHGGGLVCLNCGWRKTTRKIVTDSDLATAIKSGRMIRSEEWKRDLPGGFVAGMPWKRVRDLISRGALHVVYPSGGSK